MRGWDLIIETKIAQAQADGAFDDLPGTGKPLVLDDDRLVPEDVRAAYRTLRNAGYVPTELVERREAADLRRLLALSTGTWERKRLLAKLALLEAWIDAARSPARRGRLGPAR